ncbi:DUF262 domain-containing protein [Pedobacter sp. Leaf170]|uniref:DUF262 domain-containing protein n=1 Tax=Pedobacter sp. Leaf170 TaxID=2876558 RepID=UPI001E56BC79|nr:DUF262 domain-containing protein [Pedobacter sp. Leaf170]
MSLKRLPGLEVASCSVKELLQATAIPIRDTRIYGQLQIPEYQRPYVWGKKQMLRLLKDLKEHAQLVKPNMPDYYLGSLILHQKGDKLNIIDGQQRITSLLILQQFADNPVSDGIAYESPVSILNIQQNISMLRKLIDAAQISVKGFDLEKINVTLVVTTSEDLAYTFFETQNTGGKRLSGADIIKSHHLRSIRPATLMNSSATRWESHDIGLVSHMISMLAKARFWNFLERREFPSYRDAVQIKEKVVEEFTENTLHNETDKSFLTVEITKNLHGEQMRYLSNLAAVRQPLYDGRNFMNYLQGYLKLYQELFSGMENHRIDARFTHFSKIIINGENGTAFLQDLFRLVIVVFVSRFGYQDLFPFSLWCFRYIYAMRVSNERTVREDGVYRFARESKILDRILHAFSADELIEFLENQTYQFNEANCGPNNVKGRYILMLGQYFDQFDKHTIKTTDFDSTLIKAIKWQTKINS